jgi:hypothetical protein
MTRFYIDGEGRYLGAFDGTYVPGEPDEEGNPTDPVYVFPELPEGAVEVPSAPADARQIWSNGAWGDVPVIIPDRVTARQFKLQLLAAGLLDQVESWIATQSQAVQIAYANSGTFVRGEPMMQSGFAALGFTSEQIDAFFTAAAEI